jgi:DNA-binding protein H-NS
MNLETKSPEELQAIIAKAQAELIERQQRKRKEVLAQIKELAASIGVNVQISDNSKSADKRSSTVVIKYRDPENPNNQWTGRGLAPKWMKALLNAGRSKEEFLI